MGLYLYLFAYNPFYILRLALPDNIKVSIMDDITVSRRGKILIHVLNDVLLHDAD